jgi:hypothetical protein
LAQRTAELGISGFRSLHGGEASVEKRRTPNLSTFNSATFIERWTLSSTLRLRPQGKVERNVVALIQAALLCNHRVLGNNVARKNALIKQRPLFNSHLLGEEKRASLVALTLGMKFDFVRDRRRKPSRSDNADFFADQPQLWDVL